MEIFFKNFSLPSRIIKSAHFSDSRRAAGEGTAGQRSRARCADVFHFVQPFRSHALIKSKNRPFLRDLSEKLINPFSFSFVLIFEGFLVAKRALWLLFFRQGFVSGHYARLA